MSLFCPKCGSPVEDGALFCEKCGQSIANLTPPAGGGNPAGPMGAQPGPAPGQMPGQNYVAPASRQPVAGPAPTRPTGYAQGQYGQYAQGGPAPQGAYGGGYNPQGGQPPQGQVYGQGVPGVQGYGNAGYVQPGAKKPFNKKLLIPIIGGPVLIAAVVILLVIFLGKGSGSDFYKREISFFYDSEDDSYFIVGADGQFSKPKPDINRVCVTADGKKAFFSTKDGDLYLYDGVATRIDGGGSVNYMVPSFDGSAVVYFLDEEIIHWTGSSKTVLASDVSYVDNICISPDGGSVGMTYTEDGESVTCLFDGKEINKQGKGMKVVAVSNGLKYVYLVSEKTQKLNRQSGIDESTREPLCASNNANMIIFNKDLSSALVCDYHGDARLFEDGGEEIRIKGFVWAPVNTIESQGKNYEGLYFANSTASIYVFNCSSFKDFFFQSDDGDIYQIDSKYELQKVTSRADSSSSEWTIRDGGTVYFGNTYGELEVAEYNSSTGSFDTKTLCEDSVSKFWVLGKNRAIVMQPAGSGAELHLVELSGEKVNDTYLGECNNDKYNAAAYTGDTLYYVLDGELYSTQGDKGVRNKQFENVLYVKALTNDVLVITVDEDRDGENEIYACANGHDFNRVSR
ncbi:MAG: zinc-ribbon domain-containing protein [Lachnospiraceae bacterium]|nr:zinc-ribbon domain-containing protein [Lachnospiraceae bacterium]